METRKLRSHEDVLQILVYILLPHFQWERKIMIRDAFFTNSAINRLFTSFTLLYLHSHSLSLDGE